MTDQNSTPTPEQRPEPGDYQPPTYEAPADGAAAPPSGHAPHSSPQHAEQPYPNPQYGQQQYAAPQYDQQQYPPQQQYGQQQYAAPQYEQQYPPQQQYPYQNPHAQQGYQQADHGQQYPYGYQQQWPAEQPRSQRLGAIGLGIVAVCAVVLAVLSYQFGHAMGQFLVDSGYAGTQTTPDMSDPELIAFSQSVAGLTWGGTLAALVGIAGWIVSIVATVRRQGRNLGIIGILVGIAAPVIGFIALMAGLWPAAQALA